MSRPAERPSIAAGKQPEMQKGGDMNNQHAGLSQVLAERRRERNVTHKQSPFAGPPTLGVPLRRRSR